MTIVKSPQSDVTSDVYIETQEVTLSSGTKTVSFSAPFNSAPKVVLTSGDNGGTAQAVSIDEDGTHDASSVDIVGNNDEDVQVLAIGK